MSKLSGSRGTKKLVGGDRGRVPIPQPNQLVFEKKNFKKRSVASVMSKGGSSDDKQGRQSTIKRLSDKEGTGASIKV